MRSLNEDCHLLIVDDDPDDRDLLLDAMTEIGLDAAVSELCDGVALLDYLHGRGAYADSAAMPLPKLILLDLNMPRKDGREALREIRSDPELRGIPVIIFSTSGAPEDVAQAYEAGANSFVRKPAGWQELVQTVRAIIDFWLDTAKLPDLHRRAS